MFIISLLYFTTRLPFLRNYPIFYDSFEYLRLAEKLTSSNFSEILRSTHQPVHTFYFVTILIFKKLFFFLSPQDILLIISLIFGYLSVLIWYLFVNEVLNKKIALYSSLLVLVFPYFFAANTNILYESELIFFQILSLYFFVKKRYIFSSAAFAVGQLIFIGNIIVLPVFFFFMFQNRNKTKSVSLIRFLLVSSAVYLLSDLLLLKTPDMFLGKYGYHIFNFTSTKQGVVITTARIIRNVITQTSAVLSITGSVFLLIGIITLLIKKNGKILLYLLWIIPLFFIMQYWPVGLYGRLALFLIFPSSLIITSAFSKSRLLLISILVFVSLTMLHYARQQKQPAPLYTYYSFVEPFKKNNTVFITSDFNRFLYEKNGVPIFIFNGLDQNISQAEQFILENLKKGKRVVVDSAGLRFPFYQFDGSFYHILSLGRLGESQAKRVLENFDFKPLTMNQDNKEIFFLQITKPSEQAKTLQTTIVYPRSLYSINHNQSYSYDPLANLFYLILKKKDPAYWTYDKM